MSKLFARIAWTTRVVLGVGLGDRYADEGRPHLRIKLMSKTAALAGLPPDGPTDV